MSSPQQTQCLLIAHGSRNPKANDEVFTLGRKLGMAVAFLDTIAQPNIPEVVEQLVADGATELRIVPYFLNSGNHVQRDIPAIITRAREQHPHVTFTVTEHIGAHPKMVTLLKEISQG